MVETGVRNGAYGADKFGFKNLAGAHWNLPDTVLVEHACIAAAAPRTSMSSSMR